MIKTATAIIIMKLVLTIFADCLCVANARLISRGNATLYPAASVQSNNTRYAILDNDWGALAFIPYLLALEAVMDVLGLVSDTANTWVGQTTLHGVSIRTFPTQSQRRQIISLNVAYSSRKRQSVLYSRSQRRNISSDTDLSTFPNMATILGEP